MLDRAEVRQFFRIIDSQADHMDGLISDLLDAGRIEAGTLSVDPEPTEVAALVDGARNTFLSGGGRHAVRIDLPPGLPRVMADRGRIVQVLNNLFSNAARHSPESSPILVDAAPDGAHVSVSVSVSDEGRGVAPERLPQLFRKYADTGATESGTAGTGLGLAICKGLVEAHGGRISAQSGGEGRGTRITFTLPATEETAAPVPGRDPAPSGRGREAAPVLVVDDDPQTLRYVRDALSEADYPAVVTADPGEIPGLITTKRPGWCCWTCGCRGSTGSSSWRASRSSPIFRSSSSPPTAATRPWPGHWTPAPRDRGRPPGAADRHRVRGAAAARWAPAASSSASPCCGKGGDGSRPGRTRCGAS